MKSLYSVSTPNFSYAFYNYMTLTSSPKDVIEKIKRICSKAFDMTIEKMNSESKKYSSMSGKKVSLPDMKPNVIAYEELCSLLENKNINTNDIKEKYANSGLDTRDMTAKIIADFLQCIPEIRPVIVIALAPPYYPHRIAGDNFKNILDVCSKVVKRSETVHKDRLIQRDFFPGLCDLSYLGFDNPDNYYTLKSNMPALDGGYKLPVDALSNINIGGLNIGVMGRDVHKYTERLNMPYSFKVTPDLVLFAVKEFLA
jgi:arginine utilization protein RocB